MSTAEIATVDLCEQIRLRLHDERARNPRETKRSALRLALMSAIGDGVFKPGDRLPPEAELAQRLQLAPGTVQSALGQLQDLGLIIRRRGDGTRVADAEPMGPSVWHFRFRVLSTQRPLRLTSARIEVLRSNETGPWTEHLGEGPYIVLRRRLSGDGIGIGAEMYLPGDLINIDTIELSELEGVNLRVHLEALLGQRAQRPSTQVAIKTLAPRQAALFEMTPEASVFHITARTYLNHGRPFYHQDIYAPGDQLTLEF